MQNDPKKSLAIFRLTSCGGCIETSLNISDQNFNLHTLYEVDDFSDAKPGEFMKKYDTALIEGQPKGKRQIELARAIRRQAEIIVAVGACAQMGGVFQKGTLLPKEKRLQKLMEIIRIDYIVPGCPPDRDELTHCLMDLYWGKIFRLPDLAVCFECRQNENECLLKKNKLCLGPITRMGCDSICVNNGEACLGCRGLKPDANLGKIREVLKPIVSEQELEKTMTIFGDLTSPPTGSGAGSDPSLERRGTK